MNLDGLYRKYHANGLEVVGVSVDRQLETLKAFVSRRSIEWPQYWDGKGMKNALISTAHVTRAGATLLIGKNGLLHDVEGDVKSNERIRALLSE